MPYKRREQDWACRCDRGDAGCAAMAVQRLSRTRVQELAEKRRRQALVQRRTAGTLVQLEREGGHACATKVELASARALEVLRPAA
jgi:hypothetical protein